MREGSTASRSNIIMLKTFNLLFWDRRCRFSEGRGSAAETRRMCSAQDIQPYGSWWSPSCQSIGADACTDLCQTAGTQMDGTWFTYTKLLYSFPGQMKTSLVEWMQLLSSPWASWSHWVWCSVWNTAGKQSVFSSGNPGTDGTGRSESARASSHLSLAVRHKQMSQYVMLFLSPKWS